MNALARLFFAACLAFAAAVPTTIVGTATENPHPSSSSFPVSPNPAPLALISVAPAASPSAAPTPVAVIATPRVPPATGAPSAAASKAATAALSPVPSKPAPAPTAAGAVGPKPAPGTTGVVPSNAAQPAEEVPRVPVSPDTAEPSPDAPAVDPVPEAVAVPPLTDFSPEPLPESTDAPVCFPGDASVVLESGDVISMEDLQVGHRVQVGVNQYSDVVMFTHAISDIEYSSFVKLTTQAGRTLRATQGHYIYADGKLTRMGDVAVGNSVHTASGDDDKVVSIQSHTSAKGLYNPQTAHGDIVVNDIRASTYTTTISNKAAHALLAPVRAAFEWTGLRIDVLEKIVW